MNLGEYFAILAPIQQNKSDDKKTVIENLKILRDLKREDIDAKHDVRDYLKEEHGIDEDFVDFLINMTRNICMTRYLENLQRKDILDLHGFKFRDTRDLVDKFLNIHEILMEAKQESSTQVTIITGWGKHSKSKALLKPFIQSYLLENNLDFVMLNEGCFRVSLRSKN
jgi:DNA-nicking Smr family endonuclease